MGLINQKQDQAHAGGEGASVPPSLQRPAVTTGSRGVNHLMALKPKDNCGAPCDLLSSSGLVLTGSTVVTSQVLVSIVITFVICNNKVGKCSLFFSKDICV